ncbi:MAG: tail fiber domain-containing protein [Proteobacteria bacterium]|nr:tail fiber domain-containing protein [Pseudomonadota bacterium]
MGWFSDLGHYINPFDKSNVITGKGGIIDEAGRGIDDKLLGGDAEDAADEAAALQKSAAVEARAIFDPFAALGQQGLEQAGFLTDPNAQFNYLQSNPLFQMGLDNLNQQTQRTAAATGRLSGDDTAMQFNQNALLAASPLLNQQTANINNLLGYGLQAAGSQGNYLTGGAAAEAAGIIGGQNARTEGVNNLLNLGGSLLGTYLSDKRLKSNITKIGEQNGFNKYSWDWNEKANELGLYGESFGVIAQEVAATHPDAVVLDDNGYFKVNYEIIGVSHGA